MEEERAMAPHSSVLAWRIPGTGEPGAAVYGVAQSRTRLKRLSSSSSSSSSNLIQNKGKLVLLKHWGRQKHFRAHCGSL